MMDQFKVYPVFFHFSVFKFLPLLECLSLSSVKNKSFKLCSTLIPQPHHSSFVFNHLAFIFPCKYNQNEIHLYSHTVPFDTLVGLHYYIQCKLPLSIDMLNLFSFRKYIFHGGNIIQYLFFCICHGFRHIQWVFIKYLLIELLI